MGLFSGPYRQTISDATNGAPLMFKDEQSLAHHGCIKVKGNKKMDVDW